MQQSSCICDMQLYRWKSSWRRIIKRAARILQRCSQKSWYIMYCRVKAKHLSGNHSWNGRKSFENTSYHHRISVIWRPPGQIWGQVLDSVLEVGVTGVGGEAASALQEPSLPLPAGQEEGWSKSKCFRPKLQIRRVGTTLRRWPQKSGGLRLAVEK